jgi:hypothetical protein
MTEVSFAKTFLGTLQSKPAKLSADHVEDPKTYPSRAPVSRQRRRSHSAHSRLIVTLKYILPRMPNQMSKRVHLAPGQERSVTVSVKSLRNPPLDVKLSSQPLGTSILDIKAAVSSQARIPLEKLKVLHNKKPVPDSKVLKDLVEDDDSSVELSVMVLGGASAVQPDAVGKTATATAQGASGAEVLKTEAFWDDLKGFLLQRLRDEEQSEALYQTFRGAWQARR